MKRVALYLRVSTDAQAKDGDSLREQQDTLKAYVDSQKDMIVHSMYIDDGISGQKLERDEFQRLMNDVKNDKIDVILFTKLDRWFRSLKHYLNIEDVLQKHNVHWLAVSQPFYDTTTPYGRTFINQVMSFAELEAQMTSERIHAVFKSKVAKGEVISGSTPLGYKIENKRLVPDENAPMIQDLFDYFLRCGNLNQTSDYCFNTYNIRRNPIAIRRLLRTERYIGINRDNKNFCEPIVDKETFDAVNRMLDVHRDARNDKKHEYLFTGVLHCAHCGKKMNGTQVYPKRKMADGTLKKYPPKSIYRCTYALRTGPCDNKKRIYDHLLEKYLLDNFKLIVQNQIDVLSAQKGKSKKQDNQLIIAKINKKLKRLKQLYLDELISIDEYKQDRLALEKEMPAVVEVKEESTEDKIERLQQLLETDILKHYQSLDTDDKALFWKKLIDRIEFDINRNISVLFL